MITKYMDLAKLGQEKYIHIGGPEILRSEIVAVYSMVKLKKCFCITMCHKSP